MRGPAWRVKLVEWLVKPGTQVLSKKVKVISFSFASVVVTFTFLLLPFYFYLFTFVLEY
jgi:hypothetical protein